MQVGIVSYRMCRVLGRTTRDQRPGMRIRTHFGQARYVRVQFTRDNEGVPCWTRNASIKGIFFNSFSVLPVSKARPADGRLSNSDSFFGQRGSGVQNAHPPGLIRAEEGRCRVFYPKPACIEIEANYPVSCLSPAVKKSCHPKMNHQSINAQNRSFTAFGQ